MPSQPPLRHDVFSAVFGPPSVPNLQDLAPQQRQRLAASAVDVEPERQKQYMGSLNQLQPSQLLAEELAFFTHARHLNQDQDQDQDQDQPHGQRSTASAAAPSVASTSLTDMSLERGDRQYLSHTKKIVHAFEKHSQNPAQPLPRKNRRGTRGAGTSRLKNSPTLAPAPAPAPAPAAAPTKSPAKPPVQSRAASPRAVYSDSDTENDDMRSLSTTPKSSSAKQHVPPPFPFGLDPSSAPASESALHRMRQLRFSYDQARLQYKTYGKHLVDLDARMRNIVCDMLELASAERGVPEAGQEE
ncbi:hypothetical protein ColTof4_13607 [Colletotrichum tofieldiae]|nr:hypothetical protein ColTof3_14559 [Colletotrichum tofieldiae]GKT81184.1 hypothetical protein ColTof4_13607 [Colletotrichum tofieldiae]